MKSMQGGTITDYIPAIWGQKSVVSFSCSRLSTKQWQKVEEDQPAATEAWLYWNWKEHLCHWGLLSLFLASRWQFREQDFPCCRTPGPLPWSGMFPWLCPCPYLLCRMAPASMCSTKAALPKRCCPSISSTTTWPALSGSWTCVSVDVWAPQILGVMVGQEAWQRIVQRKVWGLMYMACCGIIDFAKEDLTSQIPGQWSPCVNLKSQHGISVRLYFRMWAKNFHLPGVLLLLHWFNDLLLFIFHFFLYGAMCLELIPFTSPITELVTDGSPCKPCLAEQTFLPLKGGLGIIFNQFNNMTVLIILGFFSMNN